MLFVGAGYNVVIYDVVKSQLDNALLDIGKQLAALQERGLLRGTTSAEEQFQLIGTSDDLRQCVQDAVYVQECVPESLEMKLSVFKELDSLADKETILASSSSAIPCSKFTENLINRHRCIIAHPVNPPYYMPLVELVPSPWTEQSVIDRTRSLMTELGQSPVTLKKEVRGFIQPRIQYAIIMECLKLVQENVLDIEDVDKLVKDGLGLLSAFLGPFEMNHLNDENGIRSFFASHLNEADAVLSSLGAPVPMDSSSPLVGEISNRLESLVPVKDLVERRRWRDERLAALAKLRSDLDKDRDSC